MKKLVLGLLISFNTFASLPSFEGHFHYQNESKITGKKRYEIVNTLTSSGKTRLEELKQENNICMLINGPIYECSKFTMQPSSLDQIAIDDAIETNLNQFVYFNKAENTPILTNDSESIKEWTYDQGVSFKGRSFDFYRLLDLGSVQKISLGNPTVFSFVVKNDVLLLVSSKRFYASKNVSELITIESIYSKN